MLKFLVILAAWVTPGILLFVYLVWISKRKETSRAEPQAAATVLADSKLAKDPSTGSVYLQQNSSASSRKEARG